MESRLCEIYRGGARRSGKVGVPELVPQYPHVPGKIHQPRAVGRDPNSQGSGSYMTVSGLVTVTRQEAGHGDVLIKDLPVDPVGGQLELRALPVVRSQ
jgi:hypothetical protein